MGGRTERNKKASPGLKIDQHSACGSLRIVGQPVKWLQSHQDQDAPNLCSDVRMALDDLQTCKVGEMHRPISKCMWCIECGGFYFVNYSFSTPCSACFGDFMFQLLNLFELIVCLPFNGWDCSRSDLPADNLTH